MKLIIKTKTIFLILLLFISQLAKAQGSDAVMAGAVLLAFILAGLLLMAIIMLIVFIVKRNKTVGIISTVFGFFILLAGVGVSMVLGDNGLSELVSIGSWLTAAGSINLLLVFAFKWVFPKKAIVEAADPETEALEGSEFKIQPDASGEPVVKWLSLLLAIWFFYDLQQAFQYLRYSTNFSSDYDDNFLSGINLYFTILQLGPLLLLLICISLFITRHRTGWILVVFYSVYTLSGYAIYFSRTTFFSSAQMQIPASIMIIQFVVIAFFSIALFLSLKPNVRLIFSVDQKLSNTTLGLSVVIAAILLFATNFLLY